MAGYLNDCRLDGIPYEGGKLTCTLALILTGGNPAKDFDNVDYLLKMLPYAGGMSYRNQPTEELTAKMINLTKDSGYRGWLRDRIERTGRDNERDRIAEEIPTFKKVWEWSVCQHSPGHCETLNSVRRMKQY